MFTFRPDALPREQSMLRASAEARGFRDLTSRLPVAVRGSGLVCRLPVPIPHTARRGV